MILTDNNGYTIVCCYEKFNSIFFSCCVSMPPNPRALTKHTIRRNIVETALCLLNVVVDRENEIGTYITINNKYIYRICNK